MRWKNLRWNIWIFRTKNSKISTFCNQIHILCPITFRTQSLEGSNDEFSGVIIIDDARLFSGAGGRRG